MGTSFATCLPDRRAGLVGSPSGGERRELDAHSVRQSLVSNAVEQQVQGVDTKSNGAEASGLTAGAEGRADGVELDAGSAMAFASERSTLADRNAMNARGILIAVSLEQFALRVPRPS